MHKLSILLLLFLISVFSFAESSYGFANIEQLINIGEIETRDISFSGLKNASQFIFKFNLSEEEIQMIGTWLKNDFVEYENDTNEIFIMFVDFLPNRILLVTCSVENNHYILYFNWKVQDNNLMLNPVGKAKLKTTNSVDIFEDIIILNSADYIILSEIEKFEKGYFQKKPFLWEKSFEAIGLKQSLKFTDFIRIRHLFPGSRENIYLKIENDKTVLNTLLIREEITIEYLKKLYFLSIQ